MYQQPKNTKWGAQKKDAYTKNSSRSWKRGEPATFPLKAGSLIPGWVQGIPGMKVGGRRELVIPSQLAYGKTGNPKIGPNEPLIFIVDMLKTKNGAPTG